jgi:hypothetical protein
MSWWRNAGVEGSSPSLSTINSITYPLLGLQSRAAGQYLDRLRSEFR